MLRSVFAGERQWHRLFHTSPTSTDVAEGPALQALRYLAKRLLRLSGQSARMYLSSFAARVYPLGGNEFPWRRSKNRRDQYFTLSKWRKQSKEDKKYLSSSRGSHFRGWRNCCICALSRPRRAETLPPAPEPQLTSGVAAHNFAFSVASRFCNAEICASICATAFLPVGFGSAGARPSWDTARLSMISSEPPGIAKARTSR